MTTLPDGFQQESNRTSSGIPVRVDMCARLRDQRPENNAATAIHEGSPRPSTTTARPVDNPPAVKLCRTCGLTLPTSEFNRSARDGFQAKCKSCKRAYNAANRDDIRARERAYSARRAGRPVGGPRPIFPPETPRRLRKYGLTPNQYRTMFENQAGRCAIRREAVPLVVDHDHDTGEVRGLLCSTCNTGIGMLRDDSAVVRAALVYLATASRSVAAMLSDWDPIS